MSSGAGDRETARAPACMQSGSAGLILDAVRMRDIADKNVEFRASLMRHEQALFAQAQQAGACNVSHAVESRLARWLLRARDLSGSDSLPLTQEYLAQMLG